MTRWPGFWLAALLAACATADPAAERAEVQQDLTERLGQPVALPAADDLDPAIGAAVRELLADELTEDEAVRIALANHRGLRATYEQLGIARADYAQATLLRNPVVDADPPVVFGGNGELEFGFIQPLFDLFQRPLRTAVAEHELRAVRAAVTRTAVQLAFAVRRAYVDVLAAQQLVELHRRDLAAAQASHELMRMLHQAGNSTDQQLAAARLGETRARLDLAAAEQQAQERREPLQALLSLWGDATSWTIRGGLPLEPVLAPATADLEAKSVERSLELAAARARIDALAQRVELVDWQGWFREFDLGLAAQREPGEDWNLGPKLTFELPLFDRGQAQRSKAGAQLREALQRYAQLAVEVRAAARLQAVRAQRLAERLRFWRDDHLPARADLLFRTEQVYQAMQRGAFDVLAARQQQLADYRSFLAELRQAHRTRLDGLELLAGSRPADALTPTDTLNPTTAELPAGQDTP